MEIFIIVMVGLTCIVAIFSVVSIMIQMMIEKRTRNTSLVLTTPAEECPEFNLEGESGCDTNEPDALGQKEASESVVTICLNQENFRERLLRLSKKERHFCRELERIAQEIPKIKQKETDKYVDYKIGASRIVRILVKRQTLICEFIIIDPQYRVLMKENKDIVKPRPIVIKVVDEDSFLFAKQSLELAYESIKEEKRLIIEKRKDVSYDT